MSETSESSRRQRRAVRSGSRRRRVWIWIGATLLAFVVCGIIVGVAGTRMYSEAQSARSALAQVPPLATKLKSALVASDTQSAASAANEMKALTSRAHSQTSGYLWRNTTWIPFLGPNVSAVADIAEIADAFVADAALPASSISLTDLTPVDGRIDVARLQDLRVTVGEVDGSLEEARAAVSRIDRGALIDQVSEGVSAFGDALDQLVPLVTTARDVLSVLPSMLGADHPQHYLVMVQNNAESRGTGGNPAALVYLTVTDGVVSITQQASSSDFDNGRAQPVLALNPESEALYGDKIGRYMQDVTTTADFSESAALIRAFWAERFGTPVDAVVSIDPIALSYIIGATRPIPLPNGETLTEQNTARILLSDVYSRYSEPKQQDAFFAAAAGAVFSTIVSDTDPKPALEAVKRAVSEGRILYAPSDPLQLQLLDGSRVLGRLPESNETVTMLGAYINDVTEGKLDYYLETSASVSTTLCDAPTQPTFTTTITLRNALTAAEATGLATYVSPARFFPKGDISTDVVLYGPIGAQMTSVSVDGEPKDFTPLTHLGRPASKINVINKPGQSHTISATFVGTPGTYGTAELWSTPMVLPTTTSVEPSTCE